MVLSARRSWLLLVGATSACSLDGLTGGAPDAGPGTDAGVVSDASSGNDAAVDSGKPVPTGDASTTCAVESDKKLHCHYSPYTSLYPQPNFDAPASDHLNVPGIPFDCWGTGAEHIGNNTTWYRTFGDDQMPSGTRAPGWAQGADLSTPDAFDANPSAFGLALCP